MDEIIYILNNEAMPDYVKIGITKRDDLEERVRELSRATSIPLPFEVFYAAKVPDAEKAEKRIHNAFKVDRVNPKREFFSTSPERIVEIIKIFEIENITPKNDFVETKEDQQALDKAHIRRANFNFKIVEIPVGAELVFSRDKNIKARVTDDRSIEYDGKVTSLSDSARKILDYDYRVAGTLYWMYQNETLDERRRRFESGE